MLKDTGSDTFFRYQIFPIPVPILFSGTNFFRYRFRYHQKNQKFPVPGIPGTGTSHSAFIITFLYAVWTMFQDCKGGWKRNGKPYEISSSQQEAQVQVRQGRYFEGINIFVDLEYLTINI